MHLRLQRVCFFGAIIVALCVALLLAASAWYIKYGNHLPDGLTEKLNNTFSRYAPGYTIMSESMSFEWRGFKNPIGLVVRDMGLIDESGNQRLAVPLTEITLNWGTLISSGEIDIASVRIFEAEFILRYNAQNLNQTPALQLEDTEAIKPTDLMNMMASYTTKKDSPHFPTLIFYNTTLYLDNGQTERLQPIPQLRIEVEKETDELILNTEAVFENVGGNPFTISVNGLLNKERQLDLDIDIDAFPSQLLADITPRLAFLRKTKLNVNGNAHMEITPTGSIKQIGFRAKGKGPDKLRLEATGRLLAYSNNPKHLYMHRLNANLVNMDISTLPHYWPPALTPNARRWVFNNVTKGIAHKADIAIILSEEQSRQRPLPADSLSGSIHFSGLNATFLRNYPQVMHLRGDAAYDANNMYFDVASGAFLNSEISGKLDLRQLNNASQHMQTSIALNGPIQNVIDIAQNVEKDDSLEHITAHGTADSTLHITMPLIKPTLKNTDIVFNSAFEFARIGPVYRQHDVQEGKLKLEYDNKNIRIKGTGNISQIPAQYTITNHRESGKRIYDLRGKSTMEHWQTIGVPLLPYVNGEMDAHLIMVEQPKQDTTFEAALDFTHANLNPPLLSWSKGTSTPATLKAKGTLEQGEWIKAETLNFESKDIALKGSLDLPVNAYVIPLKLKLDSLKSPNNDFALILEMSGAKNISANLTGKKYDMQKLIDVLSAPKEGPVMDVVKLNVGLDEAYMQNDVTMRNLWGMIDCAELCHTIKLEGIIGDNATFKIDSVATNNKGSKLHINSGEMAMLLKGLGVKNRLGGGRLEIVGELFKQQEGLYLKNGIFKAKDFTVYKAPVLAKLLSLGSLTGILNTLDGSGIKFNRLRGEFSISPNSVTITNTKMVGSSLGLTMDGVYQRKEQELDMAGTLIPAYGLNTFISNIPLIGEAIAGGRGEGLVATNYTLKGPVAKPNILVNPLSALTPGFLRKIWGDTTPKAAKEAEQEMKDAETTR